MENSSSPEDKKNVCALEHNIKTKGEFSYYYAHGRKFEGKNEEQGQIVEGPGIITGGNPVLLESKVKNVEIIKEPKKFTKYIFYDDDKNVVIKIDIPESILNLINIECININFQERALDLKVDVPNEEPYFLSFKKLFQKIVPEECKFKIFKGKICITLRKMNESEEWDKLNA
jgi:hypothetical protein